MPKAKPKAQLPWPERVKALLEREKWTHAELARRLGIKKAAVGHYVTGHSEPSGSVKILLTQIEENAAATVDYLLAGG